MKRYKPLRRKTWLKSFGRVRKRRQAKGEIYGPYHEWVKTLPCLCKDNISTKCGGPVDAHHVKSVGAGGKDYANQVPLCRLHHQLLHTVGRGWFEDVYGFTLTTEAKRIAWFYGQAE